jgi:aspartate aminotransferase-like enzyme
MLVPEGINGEKLVKTMRDVQGITFAGGQGDLKGKAVRMAHMGCLDEYDTLVGIACLEKVLKEMGHKFELGAGLAAAQKVLNS